MGFSEKAQVEGGLESENRKWVIAGIALRGPLKPIYTIPAVEKVAEQQQEEEEDQGDMMEEEECYSSTTPKGEEARIPTTLTCPPAPRKQKPSLKCNYRGGGAREFFTPPDLETVFIRHVN